mmetsp:Transcript_28876/g.84655  ORF Transcript_28876/g.84655 Transcript_28876/m.84655 type:complete len:283 (-) Transcript_28876:28-876(-)
MTGAPAGSRAMGTARGSLPPIPWQPRWRQLAVLGPLRERAIRNRAACSSLDFHVRRLSVCVLARVRTTRRKLQHRTFGICEGSERLGLVASRMSGTVRPLAMLAGASLDYVQLFATPTVGNPSRTDSLPAARLCAARMHVRGLVQSQPKLGRGRLSPAPFYRSRFGAGSPLTGKNTRAGRPTGPLRLVPVGGRLPSYWAGRGCGKGTLPLASGHGACRSVACQRPSVRDAAPGWTWIGFYLRNAGSMARPLQRPPVAVRPRRAPRPARLTASHCSRRSLTID